MKNLVLAVSPDSSLDLLRPYSDIIVLDTDKLQNISAMYETVYIRSHFSQPSTLPQNFRNEIDNIVSQVRAKNPNISFIDSMDDVDKIVAFEDKWLQYKTFEEYMPKTELLSAVSNTDSFEHPIYKNRLSSRGNGVTWNSDKVAESNGEWIVQESLDIKEELRIYIILGEVFHIGAVKQSMTEGSKAQGIDSRELSEDEIVFSQNIIKQVPDIDIVGVDVARTQDGVLYLLEANRSPGFAKFYELTGINLAEKLY